MLLVSGTKRSGTSMWMQVMKAAGFPILGEAFPRNWGITLKDANPDGFFESTLRQGIYWRTNPHPITGKYFLPDEVSGYAVKIFVPGVIRTERAYIDKLIANIRSWREYEASLARLSTIEQSQRKNRNERCESRLRLPAAYEWWMENFALVRDISLRRYPARIMSYDRILRDPERELRSVISWIGAGDLQAAIRAVRPEHRTQQVCPSDSIGLEYSMVFDELYDTIDREQSITPTFLNELNALNRKLLPELQVLQTKIARETIHREEHRSASADECE